MSRPDNTPDDTSGADGQGSSQGGERAPERTDERMWGGRFAEATDALVQEFQSSVSVDRAMAEEDIAGSLAHAQMLEENGILDPSDALAIRTGLKAVREDIRSGRFVWRDELEDVHMNIERALTDRIGAAGGRLHTARSRNDQVATDFRLHLKNRCDTLLTLLHDWRDVLIDLAERHIDVIMPGYTHLQVAQPVRVAHHLLAYQQMFARDAGRLRDARARLDVSPLGAGALAGTSFNIDPARSAELLRFARPFDNSIDAVSDRDFAIELLSALSILMMHLSRLSEELILWSSQEFGFVTLPDSHTTGSSIMPQKKNPDVCELVRGKTGRVYGALMGLLSVMKGLPLAYNKDMQEDKEGVMDACETAETSLRLYIDMLPRMTLHEGRMRQAAGAAFSNATDLADYLARKGMPFREAHAVVGHLVSRALDEGVGLEALPLATMKQVSQSIEADVYDALRLETVVDARSSRGGTARSSVKTQITDARAVLVRESDGA